MPVLILRAAVKAGWGQGWLNPTGGSPPPPTFVPIASPPLLWGQTTSSQFGILCPIPASPGSSGEGSISLSFPLSSRISVYVCVCGEGGAQGAPTRPSAQRLRLRSGSGLCRGGEMRGPRPPAPRGQHLHGAGEGEGAGGGVGGGSGRGGRKRRRRRAEAEGPAGRRERRLRGGCAWGAGGGWRDGWRDEGWRKEGRQDGGMERPQPPPPPPLQLGVPLAAAFLPHSSLCLSPHEHRGPSAGLRCHAAPAFPNPHPSCPPFLSSAPHSHSLPSAAAAWDCRSASPPQHPMGGWPWAHGTRLGPETVPEHPGFILDLILL